MIILFDQWYKEDQPQVWQTYGVFSYVYNYYYIILRMHNIDIDTLGLVWFMVFNATFKNISAISWRSALLVEETGENNRPVASHW